MSPKLKLVADSAPPPSYDVQSALMTLPALCGTKLETVPRFSRYLAPEPERVARWRQRIGDRGFKVGIAWQGSERAVQRSFPLALAAKRFAAIPGVRVISLQKGLGLEQLEALSGGKVEDLGPDFDPGPSIFVDTAAAMSCCDLVVTPDTSIVHVAGALGAKTWVALPFLGDWRWLEGREDSPWYPTVRIFRQTEADNWGGVFDQMATALGAATLKR